MAGVTVHTGYVKCLKIADRIRGQDRKGRLTRRHGNELVACGETGEEWNRKEVFEERNQ